VFNREQAAAYLAAMIDGEGWIGEAKSPQNRAIRITNTDPVLITAVMECCDVLGIGYRTYAYAAQRAHWSGGQLVTIYGLENLSRVLAEVPFRAERKRERLVRLIASYRAPLDPDEIRRLYDEGRTMKEVAAALSVSLKRIINAMTAHGIPRRDASKRGASVWRARREKYGAAGRGVHQTARSSSGSHA
jgi:hypothetical protein